MSKLERIVNTAAVVLLLSLVGVFFVSMYKSAELKKVEKAAYSRAGNADMRAMASQIESLHRDMLEIKKRLQLQKASALKSVE
jgi:hypothetical protein